MHHRKDILALTDSASPLRFLNLAQNWGVQRANYILYGNFLHNRQIQGGYIENF